MIKKRKIYMNLSPHLKKNQQLIKKGVEFYFPIKVKKKT